MLTLAPGVVHDDALERSSVGEKILIAITGLALLLFLVAHLAGNLLLFGGPATFNAYSHALIANPFIYIAEAGLTAIFVVHAYKTVVMWWRNRSARPEPYQAKHWAGAPSRKSVASTTMIVTGAVTAAFLYLHVRGLKFGADYPAPGGVRDLYRLVVETFQNPYWVAFYEVAVVLVGLHLWHGFTSAFESLGLDHPRHTPRGRVADYLEFAELLACDALERRESCGGHFRVEWQTADGDARRDDERFSHVAAWEFAGQGRPPVRHVEPLVFEAAHPSQRSYK